MIAREQDKPKAKARLRSLPGQSDDLPYSVELWTPATPSAVERELARAVSAALARQIFKAACNEHPGRRITLRHGLRVIMDSLDG
jgi:hypothetical protein